MVNTTLPALDRRAILDVETAAVDALLSVIDNPEDRLAAAARLADENQVAADRWRPRRDAAALSVAIYDGHRAINRVVGVNRTRFYTMRASALGLTAAEQAASWLVKASREQVIARARRHDVAHIPDAVTTLPRLAQRVAAAEARAAVARSVRDRLITDMMAAGHTEVQVAEIIGRTRARVWQVMKKENA